MRERGEDISVLAQYFMERMASHLDKEVTYLTPEALSLLQAHDWPGNVRELEHAVQRAVIVCTGSAIQARDILLGEGRTTVPAQPVQRRAGDRAGTRLQVKSFRLPENLAEWIRIEASERGVSESEFGRQVLAAYREH